VEVDGRAEHDVDALAACLDGGDVAVPAGDGGIPGRTERGGGGQVEGGAAFVPDLTAHTGWPVGDEDATESDLRQRLGRPEVVAGQEKNFLFEAELVEQTAEALLEVG
jgi:hypothetical protein